MSKAISRLKQSLQQHDDSWCSPLIRSGSKELSWVGPLYPRNKFGTRSCRIYSSSWLLPVIQVACIWQSELNGRCFFFSLIEMWEGDKGRVHRSLSFIPFNVKRKDILSTKLFSFVRSSSYNDTASYYSNSWLIRVTNLPAIALLN